MYQIKNFLENDDIRVAEQKGNIKIVEYMTDLNKETILRFLLFRTSFVKMRRQRKK